MKRNKLAVCLLAAVFILATGCADAPQGGGDPVTMIQSNADTHVMDNGVIRVLVDRATGSIETIQNKHTGVVHKDPTSGAWPFQIEVGANRSESSISPTAKNRVSKTKFYRRGGRDVIEMTYNELVTDSKGNGTGILAKTYVSIGAGDEYIKISADFDLTRAREGIRKMSFCEGGSLRSGAGLEERMTAPTWGGGVYWKRPADNPLLNNGVTLGYPGINAQSLEAGWMDVHGDESGIGIGFLNKQQLYSEFEVASLGQTGMSISPTLFYPTMLGVYDLELEVGTTFSSDEVIVAAHSGDWHAMADIYRREYEKAFVNADGTPDYLTADTLSQKVKDYDYIVRGIAGMDGELVSTFAQMKETFDGFVEETSADPARGVLWVAGQNPQGYAFDVPFMTPTYPQSGGDAGLKALIDGLHAEGAGVYVYEHPFAADPNHPEIAEILDDVCPGGSLTPQHTETWNMCTHYSLCTENETMQNLWKDKILPPIRALGADGLQFDQSSLQQTVCDRPGHLHGLDAVSRLSAHIRGNVRLSKLARAAMGEGSYLMSESFNDLTARYNDCASNAWFNVDTLLFGADGFEYGCTQYTHPYIRYQPSSLVAFSADNKVTVGVLIGAVTGGLVCAPEATSQQARLQYVAMKQALREADAPGYPFGYRDTLGLKCSDANLFARVFTDGERVTLTYTAFYGCEAGTVTVDLEALGFAGKGKVQVQIPKVPADTAGYQIIDPSQI